MDRVLIERRILAAMDAACATAAQWGRDDCATWCADILAPVLGYDPISEWRGRWKTKRGALRLLRRDRGLEGALLVVANTRGWQPIEAIKAKVGDVGLIEGLPSGPAIAICRAKGWFVARGDAGFAAFPSYRLHVCWAIR